MTDAAGAAHAAGGRVTAYVPDGDGLAAVADPAAASVIWIDLFDPDQAELDAAGARLGVEAPTRADMEEIETSSRLYMENGVGVLTATIPYGAEAGAPGLAPVTFMVGPGLLVTIRHHAHRAFDTFVKRARYSALGCAGGSAVLLGLLDAVTDRIADLLEHAARKIDALATKIFRPAPGPQAKSRDFQTLLEAIGHQGDLLSKLRESLSSLERLFGFLGTLTVDTEAPKDSRAFVKSLTRDAHSLIEYAEFLSQKITLLLDATLGMINIEQSKIIKIFSVVAVVFLPPTLIASIYGMNFEAMPELDWVLGYPFAITMMVVFAILPYLLFRSRGWL
jgi:magnesium transporter